MGLEFEMKYRAEPEDLIAIRDGFPGEYTAFQMATTYYDTPGGELSRRRWTLRHRRENDRHVCTLKTPLGPDARQEIEVECADIRDAIVRFGVPGLEELTAGGIVCVCGARFTRQALTFAVGESTAELALDRGVLLGGGRELPFAEVEVELKSGDPAQIRAFAQTLAERFGLSPEPKSKFARARQLAEGRHGL